MTIFEKGKAIGMYEKKASTREIVKHLNRFPSSISRLILKYREKVTVERVIGSGRPRKTTPKLDRRIKRLVRVN